MLKKGFKALFFNLITTKLIIIVIYKEKAWNIQNVQF